VAGNDVVFRKDGAVARITINREGAYNALNSAILNGLEKIFSDLEGDKEIIVVVITGAGQKAFIAGADIKEIKEAGDTRTELVKKGQEIFSKIRNSSKVVIAAVNGYALGGGCELALSCDIRIASNNARFGLTEVKLGLMPGYGGTQLLPRFIGTGAAKYLIFSGEMITAEEAYRLGLVERVCKSETLMEEVDELARKISSNGHFAVRACKRAINFGTQLSIDDALKLELEIYDKVARSADAEEGIAAFLEKKAPVFKGR
jgi:enoyl-CoA hydratase